MAPLTQEPSAMSEVGQLTIPLFVGTVLNWSLSGVLAVQVYIYFLAFPKDRPLTKVLVAFVCLLEIVQTLADSHDTLVIFGADWGNRESLDNARWGWFSVPILGSIVASVGQVFFAWRIQIIGDTLFVPAVITALSVFQLGAGIWTGVDIVNAGKFSVLQFKHVKAPVAWLAVSATCDLLIVGATVFFITRARQTEFKTPTSLAISRIIKVSVETGLVCALFAVADLSLYVTYNGNNYHLGICIWLSKVYSNSMLLILNSRAYIGHEAPPDSVCFQETGILFQSLGGPGRSTAVHVSIDVEAQSDSPSSSQIDLSNSEKSRTEIVV
ncbi:hypothetical protein DFH06DRAFT_1065825 [Mycena polygramma]|nr:hypothetical protein DFH06DRAFT_1065825 [Mycena polygramma]